MPTDLFRRLKWLAGTLAVLGAILGGVASVDSRYAKAEQVQQQIGDIKLLYLHSERRALERAAFELDVASQQRRLTPIEMQRRTEIGQDLARVRRQIERLEQKP